MRVGIVGCGWVAEHRHIPAYRNIADLDIVALCDVNEAQAKALSGRFGVSETYTDYRAMFEKEALDIVTIATTPKAHAEIAVAAAERRIHVFCEKPLAVSMDEANAIVQSAESNRVKLMVNHSYRRFPQFETTKKVLDERMIGDVFYANLEQFVWNDRFQGTYVMPNIVHEMGIHYIDLLRWLIGKDAERVYALGTNLVKQVKIAEKAMATITIDFGDEVMGRIDVSWISKGTKIMEKARVDGTQGCILINWDRPVAVYTDKPPHSGWHYPQIQRLESINTTFEKNMRLFIEAIKEDTEPPISGKDNLKTLRIVFGAIESMKTKQAVELKQ